MQAQSSRNLHKKDVHVLFGATASGKSRAALQLVQQSERYHIVNSDPYQMYEELPILTAQPPKDAQRHHLYGVTSLSSGNIGVQKWLLATRDCVNAILSEGCVPIVVGGCGMYVYSLINGLEEVGLRDRSVRHAVEQFANTAGRRGLHAIMAMLDAQFTPHRDASTYRLSRMLEILIEHGVPPSRIGSDNQKVLSGIEWHMHLLDVDNDQLRESVRCRLQTMVNDGLADEVATVRTKYGNKIEDIVNASNPIGLVEAIRYLCDSRDVDLFIEATFARTTAYIRRQRCWMRNRLRNLQVAGWQTTTNWRQAADAIHDKAAH